MARNALTRSVRWRWRWLTTAHRASLAARRQGAAGYVAAMKTSLALHRQHGFQPDEAARLGLLGSPERAGQHYVSKAVLVARQRVLNHPSFQELTEDKALFYAVCTRLGLPVPRLLGIMLRGASGLKWPDVPLAGTANWTRFFERDCPDEFVVKPSRGVYGQGIRFVDRRAVGFDAARLAAELGADVRYESYVIQECLHNHPDLLQLFPAVGLQTMRVITFVDDTGAADVRMAYLKPIGGDNRIDNHNSGRTGNFLCPVDLAHGSLGKLVVVTDAGVKTLASHPTTGVDVEGQRMPGWADVQALACRLALSFLPMRAIGWDIALTPAGPVCVEGNARWDPPKFGDLQALQSVVESHRTD